MKCGITSFRCGLTQQIRLEPNKDRKIISRFEVAVFIE